MQYRADIDGLRAIAVGAVVLYHAFPANIPGGFVGVDVFFVISGFLITSIACRDKDNGFGILHFWERRARRILPAFFVVAAVTTLAATALLLPAELRDFGQSLGSASLFASNVFFWREADYFSMEAHLRPFLHTWSLGIEEQFYVLFPVLFLAFVRTSVAPFLAVTLSMFVASFLVSYWTAKDYPTFAFYMLPSRMWELLLGVLLALAVELGARLPNWSSGPTTAVGIILVFSAILGFGISPIFPGPGALFPCVGAAMIIAGGLAPNRISRALAQRPAAWIGQISYSLYLWHWPLLVLLSYAMVRELTVLEKLAAIIVAVGLSALSWRYIEQPARKTKRSQLSVFVFASLGIAAFVAAGGILHTSRGLPGRMPEQIVVSADDGELIHNRRDCHFASSFDNAGLLCRRGYEGVSPEVLLLGDSHADMYSPAVFEALNELGISGIQLTDSGYLPSLSYLRSGKTNQLSKYTKNNSYLHDLLLSIPEIKTIVIGQFWDQSLGYPMSDIEGKRYQGPDAIRKAITELSETFPNRQFILVGPAPESLRLGPKASARLRFQGREAKPISLRDVERKHIISNNILKDLSTLPNVKLISPLPFLCNDGICPASDENGRLLYRDTDHLSIHGANLVRPMFERLFQERFFLK